MRSLSRSADDTGFAPLVLNHPRILFISQTASPIGGVETWLDHVVGAASAGGWDPLVGLVRGAKAHDPARFKAHHPNLPCVEIDGRGLDAEGRVRAVVRCIRRVRPAICVPLPIVDAHEGVCRAKELGLDCRYLQTVRGNVPAQIADAWRHGGHADLAVCPGSLACRLLAHAGMPLERVRHVPNGARMPSRERAPRMPGTPLRLAYVGRLAGGEKRVGDIVLLLDALVADGTPFHLRIVGEGGLRGLLEGAVAERGLGDRVEFRGRLSQDEIYESVYPDCDVILLFSESEAFGITLVEAMMHGVVPVSSRFVGQRSEGFLREGETGLTFAVGEMTQAAACIRRLDRDGDLSRSLSVAARNAVLARYTWEACCQGWLQAFEEILRVSPRTGPPLGPRPLDGSGRLHRSWLPASAVDAFRRLRVAVHGVPSAMVGGEEWPFANRLHSAARLAMIEALSRELDLSRDGSFLPEAAAR